MQQIAWAVEAAVPMGMAIQRAAGERATALLDNRANQVWVTAGRVWGLLEPATAILRSRQSCWAAAVAAAVLKRTKIPATMAAMAGMVAGRA